MREFSIELSLDWVMTELNALWKPLFVGSITVGLVLGVLGYFGIHIAWRMHVMSNWKKRRINRQKLQ